MTERFLAGIPFWMVLAYGAAWWAECVIPSIWMQFILVGGTSVALLLGSHRRALANSQQMMLCILIAGWLTWNCVANIAASAPVCSWWKTASYLVAAGICVMVATTRQSFAMVVEVMGSACCLTILVTSAIMWQYEIYMPGVQGGSFFFYFGFGHPNLLVNTAGLGCFSYLWWIVEHQLRGQPRAWTQRLVAVTGALAAVAIALILNRRGMFLGLFSGMALLLLYWGWHAYRRVAIKVIGLLVVATLATAVWLSFNFMHLARAERMLLYGAMIEIAAEQPWTGSGSYAARGMHAQDSEMSRHFTARGEWPLHGHNEFLDAEADGGMPALTILLLACGWIFWLSWKRQNSCERNWLLLSIGGILAVACVDNAYSRIVGLWYVAMVAGLAVADPHQATSIPKSISMPSRKPVGIAIPLMGCGMVGLAMAWSLLPASLLRLQSRTVDFVNASEAMFDPELVAALLPQALRRLDADDFEQDLLLDQHVRRIGSSRTTLWFSAKHLQETGASTAIQFENVLRLIRFVPFNQEAWVGAKTLAQVDPDLLKTVDAQTRVSLRRVSGDLTMSPPMPGQEWSDINSAISIACALRWCLLTNNFNANMDRAAERLIDRYGDVHDVGLLVCDLLCAGRNIQLTPKRCAIMYPAVCSGLVYWDEKILEIKDARIAQRILPLFKSVFPLHFHDFESGHITRGRRPWEDDYLVMHLARCHLWSLRSASAPR